jgi:hypothetical protein
VSQANAGSSTQVEDCAIPPLHHVFLSACLVLVCTAGGTDHERGTVRGRKKLKKCRTYDCHDLSEDFKRQVYI